MLQPANTYRRRDSSQNVVTSRVPESKVITTPSSSSSSVCLLNINIGHFIPLLHIEIPSFEKCSPHDLLIILQYSTRPEEFFNNRSVQCPMHPLSIRASEVVCFLSYTSTPFLFPSAPSPSPLSSTQVDAVRHHYILTPDALLHTLFSYPFKSGRTTIPPMDVVRSVRILRGCPTSSLGIAARVFGV